MAKLNNIELNTNGTVSFFDTIAGFQIHADNLSKNEVDCMYNFFIKKQVVQFTADDYYSTEVTISSITYSNMKYRDSDTPIEDKFSCDICLQPLGFRF